MKIKVKPNPNETRFYDNKGNDITDDLKVIQFRVVQGRNKAARIHMHCYIDEADIEVEGDIDIIHIPLDPNEETRRDKKES